MSSAKPIVKKTARTLGDFNAEHNPDVKIPAKIKAALAELLSEGREAWEYESEFIARCKVGSGLIAKYRDQFMKHIVDVKAKDGRNHKNVWFADPKVAARARGGET